MATDAIVVPVSRQQPIYRPINRTAERVFYTGMAILLCVCVYIGFSPTYFRAGMLRAPLPSPILHIHGAAFTLWMLLFTVQAAFISARRVKWHRSFGTVAFCLPPVMIVLGVIAAHVLLLVDGRRFAEPIRREIVVQEDSLRVAKRGAARARNASCGRPGREQCPGRPGWPPSGP